MAKYEIKDGVAIIPEGTTEIEARAFFKGFGGRTDFNSVVIPDSVTVIGYRAFMCCFGLTSITIPNSVTSIQSEAFSGCTGLTSVVIPSSAESLGKIPFYGCQNLVEVKVESGNKTYDSRDNCNAIINTESNTLFKGFSSTVIPRTVVTIGNNAFEGVLNYTNFDIPSSVKKIDDFAFFHTGLKNVMIPAGITEIGVGVFGACAELESLMVAQDNKTFDSRDNCNAIIETESNKLIAGCSNTTIPASVTAIGSHAFRGCKGLTSITIPDSVTEIGDVAFAECENLVSVVIPDSVTKLSGNEFYGCEALRSVTLPSSLAKIFLENWTEDVRPQIIKTGGKDSLLKLANKIKELLQKKKINSFIAENEDDDFFDWGRIALFECGDYGRMVYLKEIELKDGELEFKLQEVHENDEGDRSEIEEWTVDFKTLKSGWWTNKNREEPDMFNIENTLIDYIQLLED